MKNRRKKNIKITTIYKPVRQITLLCLYFFFFFFFFFFRLSRGKSVKSMSNLNVYIKVYLMHKMNHA